MDQVRIGGTATSPVSRERVADQIIGELQRRIAEGTLPRGGRIPTERELAAEFDVSAPTVREAIRALSAMGLIEVRHGSGAYVAESSNGILDSSLAVLVHWEQVGVRDLLGLLRTLHLYAGSVAADVATDDEIARVVAMAELTAQMTQRDDLLRSPSDFLHAFVAAAHQPLLDALCGYLTRVFIDLHFRFHPEKSPAYWKRWARDSSALRLKVALALASRDKTRIAEATNEFHDGIQERLMQLPGLAEARVSA